MKNLVKISSIDKFSIDTRGKPMTRNTFYKKISTNLAIGNDHMNIASMGFYKVGKLLVKAKKELKGDFGKLKKQLAEDGLHIKQQERYMSIAKNKNISINYSKMPPQWTFWEKVAMLPPEVFNKIVHLIHKGAKWKDIELFLGKHQKLLGGVRSRLNERDNRTEIFGFEYDFKVATKKHKNDFIQFEKEVKKLASKFKFIKLKKKNYFDDAMSILDEDRSKTKDDTSMVEVKTKFRSYNPKKKIDL
jgi:hypothetical protein